MMEHLSALELAQLVLAPEAAARRGHLDTCHSCASEVEEAKRAAAKSKGKPLPDRVRMAVQRRTAEDLAASRVNVQPGKTGKAEIVRNPALRTRSGVRRLVEMGMDLHVTDARSALELENAALVIAEDLAGEGHTDEDRRLVVTALLAIGNAYRFVGRFSDAHSVLTRAGEIAETLSVSAMEEARIETTRGAVLLREYRFDDALAAKENARAIFLDLGEAARLIDLMGQETAVAFLRRDFALARSRAEQALTAATASGDVLRCAHAENNLAIALQELGELNGAATHFSQAIALFDLLVSPVEKARAEWSLGLLSLRLNREADGLPRLERAIEAFQSAGNVVDAALILLDLVEFHLQCGRNDLASRTLDRIDVGALPAYATAAVNVLLRQIEQGDVPAFDDTRRQLRLEL